MLPSRWDGKTRMIGWELLISKRPRSVPSVKRVFEPHLVPRGSSKMNDEHAKSAVYLSCYETFADTQRKQVSSPLTLHQALQGDFYFLHFPFRLLRSVYLPVIEARNQQDDKPCVLVSFEGSDMTWLIPFDMNQPLGHSPSM